MSRIFTDSEWTQLAESFGITHRELQVVQGIFDDRTEAAIAIELRISPRTVHTYIERLYHKTGASSRLSFALKIMSRFLSDVRERRPGSLADSSRSTPHIV